MLFEAILRLKRGQAIVGPGCAGTRVEVARWPKDWDWPHFNPDWPGPLGEGGYEIENEEEVPNGEA